jgi:hypothetical protein
MEKLMKKLILFFVCALGVAQLGFGANNLIEEEAPEPIEECSFPPTPVCDPKTQYQCTASGGFWCNGVESFGTFLTCCDRSPSDLKLPEPELVNCTAFTSEVGHNVPSTPVGVSEKIGCYTYACNQDGSWTTSSGGCACKPNVTYYKPCGDCGTQSGACSNDGDKVQWQDCSELEAD